MFLRVLKEWGAGFVRFFKSKDFRIICSVSVYAFYLLLLLVSFVTTLGLTVEYFKEIRSGIYILIAATPMIIAALYHLIRGYIRTARRLKGEDEKIMVEEVLCSTMKEYESSKSLKRESK